MTPPIPPFPRAMTHTAGDAEMIDDCENNSAMLTDWESDFIDDVSSQSHPLTVEQQAKLREIWRKVT